MDILKHPACLAMKGWKPLFFLLLFPVFAMAQKPLKIKYTTAGIFALGVRIPFGFSDSPDGLNISQGLGLNSRIQLGKHYNTEFFGEYLNGRYGDSSVRNNAHIGASFMLYTQNKLRRVQPFFFAGPAADYEKIHQTTNAANTASRWNFAAHGGLGMHINVSWRSDVTISTAYMLRFGPKIESISTNDQQLFVAGGNGVDGQLLVTVSMNFKMLDLWKKIRW